METKKIALITGISGQDGSYLAELLLHKDYQVHGIIRRSSSIKRLDHIYNNPNLSIHYGDLSDSSFINKIINIILPDEIYNLGAMSNIDISFDNPEYTSDINGFGTLRILEAIKNTNKQIKFFQAGTSQLYGNEDIIFNPQSPYAIAKLYAYWITKNYRQSYNLFAVNGILFNHTSPRRDETFVEQKIIKTAVAILKKKQYCLYLGNMYSYSDFGHAKDYVMAMWMMLQQEKPDDFVIATGKTYMIKDIVTLVFSKIGLPIDWSGEGIDEIATTRHNKRQIVVRIDKKYFRPYDVNSLLGDPSKAIDILKWKPEYIFDTIIDEMIKEEMKKI